MRTLIQMGPIILSIARSSGFLPSVLGHPGYHWALLILWNSLFPLFLSYHTHQKPSPCPAYLRSCSKEQMTEGVLPENTTHLQEGHPAKEKVQHMNHLHIPGRCWRARLYSSTISFKHVRKPDWNNTREILPTEFNPGCQEAGKWQVS